MHHPKWVMLDGTRMIVRINLEGDEEEKKMFPERWRAGHLDNQRDMARIKSTEEEYKVRREGELMLLSGEEREKIRKIAQPTIEERREREERNIKNFLTACDNDLKRKRVLMEIKQLRIQIGVLERKAEQLENELSHL